MSESPEKPKIPEPILEVNPEQEIQDPGSVAKPEKEPDSLLEDLCLLETSAEFIHEYGEFGVSTIRKAKEVLAFARPLLAYTLKPDADLNRVRGMAEVIIKMMGHGAWTDDDFSA